MRAESLFDGDVRRLLEEDIKLGDEHETRVEQWDSAKDQRELHFQRRMWELNQNDFRDEWHYKYKALLGVEPEEAIVQHAIDVWDEQDVHPPEEYDIRLALDNWNTTKQEVDRIDNLPGDIGQKVFVRGLSRHEWLPAHIVVKGAYISGYLFDYGVKLANEEEGHIHGRDQKDLRFCEGDESFVAHWSRQPDEKHTSEDAAYYTDFMAKAERYDNKTHSESWSMKVRRHLVSASIEQRQESV